MINKVLIKNVAFVASGALFGALGGYYVAKKVISEKYEQIVSEVETDIRSRNKTLIDENNDLRARIDIYESAGLSFETAQAIAQKNMAAIAEKDKTLPWGSKDKSKKTFTNYQTPVGKVDSETNEFYDRLNSKSIEDIAKLVDRRLEKEANSGVEDRTPNYTDEEDPYMISVDEYSDGHEEYKKVTCTFYKKDEVLCENDNCQSIDHRHVGMEAIDMMANSDMDLVYVRNDFLGIDYEIETYEGSYRCEVLGESEDPPAE